MNKIIKNSFYTVSWIALSSHANLIFAWWAAWWKSEATFWTDKRQIVTGQIEDRTLDQSIQFYVNYLMTFLYLIAVLYALWGWFLILTAAWDEKKVKKWKTILIQWAIWLLVIWLSWTIIKWVLSVLVA